MLNTLRITLKQNRRERDEKITAIHSILPGDVISVTEEGGGEGRDDKKRRSQRESMRDKQREMLEKEENETDGMVQKSPGFEMHSTYFKSTGIKP